MIESEFVEIEDPFFERPRRPRPPSDDGKHGPKARHHHHKPHERTALLGADTAGQRHRVLKVVYLICFALGALEVVLITSLSGWIIHMVSCIVYETCSPTSERLASFGFYFVILFLIFLLPYLVGALGVATSSSRILWFFSFVTSMIDVIIIVLLCVYVRWEVALAMIPQILVALYGFAISSMLASEDAERGPDARRNRCCLFLCC